MNKYATLALVLLASNGWAQPNLDAYPANWHYFAIATPIKGGKTIYTDLTPNLRFTRLKSCQQADVLVDGFAGCPVGYDCRVECMSPTKELRQ